MKGQAPTLTQPLNRFAASLVDSILHPKFGRVTTIRIEPGTTDCLQRLCSNCKRWLPLCGDFFPNAPKETCKFGHKCHVCRRKTSSSWRKTNPRKAYAQSKRRRDRERRIPGTFTKEDEAILHAEAGNACQCCHRNDVPLQLDHVVPTTHKDCTHDRRNRQLLCHDCNCRKGQGTTDYRLRPACRRAA